MTETIKRYQRIFLDRVSINYLLILMLFTFQLPAFADPVEDMKKGENAFSRADIVNAIAWFKKAAEANYAPAQARLAGLLDYSENNKEAVMWYQKSVQQNNADGQYGLGVMLATGEGAKQNYQQAVKLFTLAAEQGHSQAIRTLVSAYENGGLGLEADTSRAISILTEAAEKNDSWAKNHLKKVYQKNESTGTKQEK